MKCTRSLRMQRLTFCSPILMVRMCRSSLLTTDARCHASVSGSREPAQCKLECGRHLLRAGRAHLARDKRLEFAEQIIHGAGPFGDRITRIAVRLEEVRGRHALA